MLWVYWLLHQKISVHNMNYVSYMLSFHPVVMAANVCSETTVSRKTATRNVTNPSSASFDMYASMIAVLEEVYSVEMP